LARRITEQQKDEITKLFISGVSIDKISEQFNFTKLTISRNLKNNIGVVAYKELLAASKSINNFSKNRNQKINHLSKKEGEIAIKDNKNNFKKDINVAKKDEFSKISEFIELVPLTCDFENTSQKDFSSIPISEIDFPKTVFMIVDKKVELEIKYLKDYPKWQFLSQDELKRKTIEIYYDLKIAKSFCGTEKKVIKIPNAAVLKKVAPILLSRGISRIVSSDNLISL
tara:strand:- start:916 stop:1596 length:681 start_codon:yes stop_codon:yes gene_type:complete